MLPYDTLSTAFRGDRAGLFRQMRDDEPVHVDEHTALRDKVSLALTPTACWGWRPTSGCRRGR
jgi:hypothetical protein